MKQFNVLILSVGTRNKIVQYFKEELNGVGNVIATDASDLAPALYEADKHYIVPRIDEEGYLDKILDICKKEKINTVLSLIDPELSLLAKHKEDFEIIGVTPVVSDYSVIELFFNKYEMYNHLKKLGYNTVKSYTKLEEFYKDLESHEIEFPVFVKPVKGSASININKVNNKDELELLFSQNDNLMIQEFMDGNEYGADAYIDLISNEVISIFIKEKIVMRAGETDKSRSVVDDALFKMLENFIKEMGFKGIIDIDLFKKDEIYYISEVNPRFGGGYPHGHEIGVNVPKMIINNLKNHEKNETIVGNYKENSYMMKYNEVKIIGD